MVVETKNIDAPNFVEVKKILADVKAECNSLSKGDWSFLNNFFKARKDIQERNDFTKLDALTPRVHQMKKAGTLQNLRPFIDRIVANTLSTMPSPSWQNHKEIYGEVSLGEIHAILYEEYISS